MINSNENEERESDMRRKLYGNNIEATCEYCQYGRRSSDGKAILLCRFIITAVNLYTTLSNGSHPVSLIWESSRKMILISIPTEELETGS